MHVAGVNRDARTFEHIDPDEVGADRRLLISELSGKGTVEARAAKTGVELDSAGAARVVERVKELEHRGYHLEAADGSFDLLIRQEAGDYEPLFQLESWRVIVEQSGDGGEVQTEATIKICVGDERYVRTAEGNGPVNALDNGPARCDRRALPASRRHRARQLQGPHPRRGPGHGRRDARAARRRRRRRDLGHDRRLGEHHRRELGGARRLARGRDAAGSRRARPRGRGAGGEEAGRDRRDEPIPLARPLIGAREEELVLDVLRSRHLALGPMLPAFERSLGERLGVEHVSAVSSGTAGLHLALRAAGVAAGDEVVTTPFSFVASANSILYEGARPVFCDIDPRTLNIDVEAAAAAVGASTTGLLPVHIFGYPAALPELESIAAQRGLWIVEDACEALGAVHGDGTAVGARGNPAVFAFYPNKQMTTGEGGAVVCPDAARQAADRQRAQPGSRPRHGLARP